MLAASSVSWRISSSLKIWRSERYLSEKNCIPVLDLDKPCSCGHHLLMFHCPTDWNWKFKILAIKIRAVKDWFVSWSSSKTLDAEPRPSEERIPPPLGERESFLPGQETRWVCSASLEGPSGVTEPSNLSLCVHLIPHFVFILIQTSPQRKLALINTLQFSTCQHIFWNYLWLLLIH